MAKITEPMTMLTDYLLTIFSFIFTYLILANGYDSAQLYWAISLAITGIGAFGGGTSHGFVEYLSKKQNSILWKISVISIGFASFFMTIASVVSSLTWEYNYVLFIIFLLTTLFYSYWIAFVKDEFIYVILFYVPLMLIVLILQIVRMVTLGLGLSIVLGVIVSFIAAAIQVLLRGKMPKYFNHNDLFHVVQLIGLYLFYIGAEYSKVV